MKKPGPGEVLVERDLLIVGWHGRAFLDLIGLLSPIMWV
jgi:hypothetical protein